MLGVVVEAGFLGRVLPPRPLLSPGPDPGWLSHLWTHIHRYQFVVFSLSFIHISFLYHPPVIE